MLCVRVCVFDVCLSVYDCLCVPMIHYFCTVCDPALTVSSGNEENHYWQAVMANCEMEIKPLVITAPTLSCTHRYTGEHSKTAMITDKRANNISPLSLAGRLNSNCYERHAWWTENHFECLQILLPLKLKALVEQWGKASLWNLFFFCFWEMNPTNQLPRVQCTTCCVQGETTEHH